MTGPESLPDRIGIDAAGFGWRAWVDVENLSMVPTNPDNEPVPEPVTWFVPENESAVALLGEVVDWLGVPEWPPPPMSEELGRRIARCLTPQRNLTPDTLEPSTVEGSATLRDSTEHRDDTREPSKSVDSRGDAR